MKIDRNEMLYKRLSLKDLDQQFLNRVEIGMGCSPFVSEAITKLVHDIYFPYLNSSDNFSPGKFNFQCLSKNASAATPISDAKIITVTLTLDAGKSDQDIRKKYGIKKLRQERLVRMCNEAYAQGGLLTVEDLAYRILNAGERTIVRDLSEIRKDGENPPLRSTVKDMGRTLSHKITIIKNWLKGDELSDLKRKYNHSFSAIENYINTFKRVISLKTDGYPINQIAYLVKISARLAEEYLQLWSEFSDKSINHRKRELLDLIKSSKKPKKKKKEQ